MRFLGPLFFLLRAMLAFPRRRAAPCCAPSNTRKASADPWREQVCVFGAGGKVHRPLFWLWARGIALIPQRSSSPSRRGGWRADKAHGLDRQAGGGTACGRALGVKRHAPRLAARQRGIFGLRLSQRSGRTRSSVFLAGLSRDRPWVRLA